MTPVPMLLKASGHQAAMPKAFCTPSTPLTPAVEKRRAGERTVQQIADLFSVPRTTVYGHLDPATKGKRLASHPTPASP